MEVIYERDPDVGNGYQAYRGRLQYEATVFEFEGLHFEALLRQLNAHMPMGDDALVFIRTDRPELAPYKLEDNLVILIKADVEQAIQAMTHPDVRIVIGRNPESPTMLKSCSETLAGAFGERVYSRCREQPCDVLLREGDSKPVTVSSPNFPHVECPVCGKWHALDLSCYTGTHYTFTCPDCGVHDLALIPIDSLWVSFSVVDLLATDFNRFFLPREWNNFQPWVSRDKLDTLYKNFLRSKETFHDQ